MNSEKMNVPVNEAQEEVKIAELLICTNNTLGEICEHVAQIESNLFGNVQAFAEEEQAPECAFDVMKVNLSKADNLRKRLAYISRRL